MSEFCTTDDLSRFSPEEIHHRPLPNWRRRWRFMAVGFALGYLVSLLLRGN